VDLKANIQLSLKADSFFGSVMEIKELTDYSNRARNTISMAEGNECYEQKNTRLTAQYLKKT
jgi:hypothetical protein